MGTSTHLSKRRGTPQEESGDGWAVCALICGVLSGRCEGYTMLLILFFEFYLVCVYGVGG